MDKEIKKILYVRNGPYKVNIKSYNLQEIGFSKELCKKGINCDIVYYTNEKPKIETIYKYNGYEVRIIWVKGFKILRTGIYPSLLRKKFVNNYDLIITTEYSQIMSLMWTFFKPKVVLYNGPYYNMFKIPFMEKIYDILFVKILNKRLDRIFVKSKLSKEYMEKKGFKDIIVLGVGLDNTVFDNQEEIPKYVCDSIEIMKENKCMLYIGSLDERKNTKFLFEVFEKVQCTNKEFKLVVIGKGKESYVKKCFNVVSESTKNNIIYMEKIDNRYLKNIYENAEIFLLPSKLEIFGMVLLEAMFFGVPVISSRNGGSTTLIQNNKNGMILKRFCSDEWSQQIIRILDNDKLREAMSENAMKTIKQKYTWERISSRFIDYIK